MNVSYNKSSIVFIVCSLLMLVITSSTHAQANDEIQHKNDIVAFIDGAYNNSDLSLINSLFAEDYIYHPGGYDTNRLRVDILSLRAALPDLQATPIITVADGNWVAVHLFLQGTFTNEFISAGVEPIQPTNETLQFVTNMVFHFNEAGQVYEQWVTFDNLNYLAQLDMIAFETVAWQGTRTPLSPSTDTTFEEPIRAIVTQYYDTYRSKNMGTLNRILSESFTGYNPFGSFDRPGQVGDLTSLFGAFPDLSVRLDAILIEGNYAAVLYNMNGTFTQDFVFADGTAMPPTGNRLDLIRIDFLRFNELNTIEASYEIYDGLDFMIQLGILPISVGQ